MHTESVTSPVCYRLRHTQAHCQKRNARCNRLLPSTSRGSGAGLARARLGRVAKTLAERCWLMFGRAEPYMDPASCSACGRWLKRCDCGHSTSASDGSDDAPGLLSLPEELFECICVVSPLSALGALARVSKRLRLACYQDSLWRTLRQRAPWAAATCARPLAQNASGVRLAVRKIVETECAL